MKELHERIERYGACTLSTEELLATLLFSGTTRKDPLLQAHHLLETYGVTRLRNAEITQLCKDGLTPLQAYRLAVASELVRRFTQGETSKFMTIDTAEAAASVFKPMMMHLEQEQVRVLVLNTKRHIMAHLLLFIGTINTTSLRVAETLRPAVIRNGSGIIVAHNHPSGDPTPSDQDETFTLQLVKAGLLLDIEVIDHLIIGNPRYMSLRARIGW